MRRHIIILDRVLKTICESRMELFKAAGSMQFSDSRKTDKSVSIFCCFIRQRQDTFTEEVSGNSFVIQ